MEKKKAKIESLQVIRAFACIMVILDHTEIDFFEGIGQFGVRLFFIISGFVMVLSTERKTEHLLLKRFLRIAPLYYIFTCLAITVGLIKPSLMRVTEVNMLNIVKSFCFLSIKESNNIVNPILGIGWTLNLEMAFYVVFIISTKISHKYRAVVTSFILLVTQVLWFVFNVQNFYTQPYILCFVIGMVMYYVYKKTSVVRLDKTIQYVAVGISLMLLLLVVALNGLSLLKGAIYIAVLVSFLLVIICKDIVWPNFLIWLGNISYSIYLTHTFILKGCIRILHPLDELNLLNVGCFVVYLAFIIGIGALTYYSLEIRLFARSLKKL